MEQPKDNELKLRLLIEMEQSDSEGLLSEYKSDERLRYPTLMNWQANQMSMDLNMIIKAAISDYLRGMADEKKERTQVKEEKEVKVERQLPAGAIR